jgi:N-acetylglucosaminyl-diphospho-decaprenol L-rhamnosyltransferase
MTGEPTIAVVVVCWNSAAQLPDLVASIGPGLRDLDHQLIFVDNDSADDTVVRAKELAPGCTIVQTGRNAGYAAGINAGIAAADRYDAVLVLNPDIRLTPGSVEVLYRALGEQVGITVPLIRHEDGTPARSLRRTPTVLRALGEAVLGERAGRFASLGETVVDPDAYLRHGVTDWATGAAMLISAGCATACGPWDESFFLYSEETDFALRAGDLGFETAFVPAAEVTHLGGQSRVSPALWSLLTVNRVRLYRKRHSAPATAAFWTAVFLRESSRAVLGQRRSRRAVAALLGGAVPTGG